VHPEIIFVPVILFVLFVAPIWLWLHYREKHRQREALAGLTPTGSPELARTAQRLEDRVAALEALLDAEMPDWRKRRE